MELILDKIDPKREAFDHYLYQDAAYLINIKEEDTMFFVKDVTRFKNRDVKRSLLVDPDPTSFLIAPDNGLPGSEYTAEFEMPKEYTDDYLKELAAELEHLAGERDVRKYLTEAYEIKTLLKNSKLI